MNPATILIVEDEPGLRRTLTDFLQLSRFDVIEAVSLAQMWRILQAKRRVDLVLLDLNLPDGDGLHTSQQIRSQYSCGLIMMTGRSDPIDRIIGLETGADDYISKPFEMRELLARIRSVLRRLEPSKTPATKKRYHFETVSFDPASWILVAPKAAEGETRLTEYESALLEILLDGDGNPVSRDTILNKLTGHGHDPSDRSVDNLVSRLRKKLSSCGCSDNMIKAARGIGYILQTSIRVEAVSD